MVICGVSLDPKVYGELRSERVRDSKKIGSNRRKYLSGLLKKRAEKYKIFEIEPDEIDRLRGEGTNLNEIEAIGFVEVLEDLKPKKAYIDSASANAESFRENLKNKLSFEAEIIVEHEADSNYLPVSAASIIAKVRRDERIEELKKDYGETGSGYPSDERTIKFLRDWMKNHEELPPFTRKSWKTAQRIKSEFK